MEYSTLYELIEVIESGRNFHIGIFFVGGAGCSMCDLPDHHKIHSRPVCEIFKSRPRGLVRCMRCRSYAIRRAVRDRVPFSALCINGVFEYTHPVIISGEAVAVIYIGNILTKEGRAKLESRAMGEELPLETMDKASDEEECRKIATVVESYIKMLLERYTSERSAGSAVIENVKSYVRENLEYDHKLSEIASLFFYDEVYLGRLFREKAGVSFKDYLNRERVGRAKRLLMTDLTVTEVAEEVGYNSVTYFNRVFKRWVGMTPTEYRRVK